MSHNLYFLLIPLLVITGILFSAWLVHSHVKIPKTFRLKQLSSQELSPSELEILGRYDDELSSLGFEKICDFQVIEMQGENLHRIYLHSRDLTQAMVSVITSGFRKVPQLEFYTRFQDGCSLSTEQELIPSYFEIPEERIIQRFSGMNPPMLYQAHQQKLQTLISQSKTPMKISKDSIFKIIEQDQQELLNYQIKNGYFSPDSENDFLKPTWKFSFYFIIRNLDPLPFGITTKRFIFSLLICSAIMFSVFFLARYGNVQKWLSEFSLSERQIYYSICSAGAVISSLLLGLLIQRRAFLWAGLISAIGVFILIFNLFPNAWLIILMSAQAGLLGNRIYESRLSKSPTRLPSQFLVLIALIIIGWMMLNPK